MLRRKVKLPSLENGDHYYIEEHDTDAYTYVANEEPVIVIEDPYGTWRLAHDRDVWVAIKHNSCFRNKTLKQLLNMYSEACKNEDCDYSDIEKLSIQNEVYERVKSTFFFLEEAVKYGSNQEQLDSLYKQFIGH